MPERNNGHDRRLVIPINPQPGVRENAERAFDWEYKEQAVFLYRWAVIMKERLLDPVLLTDRRRLPDPVISFENLRNYNYLAGYTLRRNPQGLLYEITFNTQNFIDSVGDSKSKQWVYGQWGLLETLLHEQVHLKQQNFGREPVSRNYHNREFVDMCEALGLHPLIGVGCHIAPADGVFAQLLKEHGITRPELELPEEIKFDWWKFLDGLFKDKKGKSTLAKWVCTPGCQSVRVGKKEFQAQCLKCGQVFVRADGQAHQLFPVQGENEENK